MADKKSTTEAKSEFDEVEKKPARSEQPSEFKAKDLLEHGDVITGEKMYLVKAAAKYAKVDPEQTFTHDQLKKCVRDFMNERAF